MLKNRFGFARAQSLKSAPVLQLLLLGSFAFTLGIASHWLRHSAVMPAQMADNAPVIIEDETASSSLPAPLQAPMQALAEVRQAVDSAFTRAKASAAPAHPQLFTREIEADSGSTFTDILAEAGVSNSEALAAATALRKVYDPRRLRDGQDVTLSFTRNGQNEVLNSITFQPEATREITITRAETGFTANAHEVPVTHQRFAARAEIHTSLYDAGERAHIPHAVMASLIRIYSQEIDFQRDIHPGDSFEILYDQPVTQKGAAVGEGVILYATMVIGHEAKQLYRVTFNDRTSDYFDEKGHSVRRALLRTPVSASHITSSFGMRMHPLLGYSKMHKGVDFGAPQGAPIFSAGSGTVVEVGFKGGYGRYIRIRHNGQLETAYAHMSRYSQNMYRGARVEQGQVIGYVGMTGRATGPHLHYEVHVAGRAINPMSLNLPTGRVLDAKMMTSFKAGQSKIRQEFAALVGKAPMTVVSVKAPAPLPVEKPKLTKVSAAAKAFPPRQVEACDDEGGC